MKHQSHHTDKSKAIDKAKEVSETEEYACVVLDKEGNYWVESEPPFIRLGEKLITQFENGKKLKK